MFREQVLFGAGICIIASLFGSVFVKAWVLSSFLLVKIECAE
jgi:hypothetical protein